MTQDESFKAWWYSEGSQAPYTHHDCEEHTMRMCEIAWANGAYKAIKELESQEPVACVQDLEEVRRKHLVYVNGMDWKDPLYTHPPQRTWVGLTPEEILDLFDDHQVYGSKWLEFARVVENKLKEKNT